MTNNGDTCPTCGNNTLNVNKRLRGEEVTCTTSGCDFREPPRKTHDRDEAHDRNSVHKREGIRE